jgi:carbamoyltransferase
MAVILGISAFHAGASACLVVDGVPVVAIAEERLNRIKYYAAFPIMAIKCCLDFAGFTIRDVQHVAVGRDPAANRLQKAVYAARNIDKLPNLLSIRRKSQSFRGIKEELAAAFEIDHEKLNFQLHHVEHHIAHTASSYFISPWEHSAGLTIDGSGDFVSCMMTECVGPKIKVLSRIFVPNSVGSLYTMVSEFIGFPSYGDEGKVMGLAAYGRDTYTEQFRDMIALTDHGFRLNQRYFMPFGANQGLRIGDDGQVSIARHYSDHMINVFGEPRKKHGDYTDRDKDLAFGLQQRFEDVYLHLANLLHQRVPISRVCLAGGCALNSFANGRLVTETSFAETCIQPAASDDGLAMGAALYVSNSVLKEGKRWVMVNAYLGDEFADERIKVTLDKRGLKYARLERQPLLDRTADHIVAGNVIGWYQGRMEWGPRALGNRSILVHPGFPNMKEILNARIKRREWFRPFAPAVLRERQHEVFEHTHPSPYMLHVYRIKPEWREQLAAVNHKDNTGRVQTVAREENPLYYDLISEFHRSTGIPVLLNTSFNENEPIVHTPDQAIDCFLRTKMDVLVMGAHICEKRAQPAGMVTGVEAHATA